jgi:hypothetical protein
MKTDRQRWFAARVAALRAWPERSREENLDAAARQPVRHLNMSRRGVWPISQLEIERRAIAPEDGVDMVKLRKVLAGLNYGARERFMALLVETLSDLEIEDSGILQRIRRAHRRFKRSLGRDPDGDLALARGAEVPRSNLHSPAFDEEGRMRRQHGKWVGE